LVELGKEVYQQNCAACHGDRGEGQPNWRSVGPDGLYPAPPHDSSGHTWHHGDGLLFGIVKDGGASLNIPNFKSGMPPFGQTLHDKKIQAVITYLKTTWGPEQREAQRGASQGDPFPIAAVGP
jgi:mono/diheme cytochrome c family protein